MVAFDAESNKRRNASALCGFPSIRIHPAGVRLEPEGQSAYHAASGWRVGRVEQGEANGCEREGLGSGHGGRGGRSGDAARRHYFLRRARQGPDEVRAAASVAPPVPAPFVVPVKPQSGPDKARPGPATQCPIRFQEVTDQSGITFEHRDGSSGRHFTPETMSAGVATFDYDGDGLIDIYFPNGAALLGTTYDPPPRHALYQNLGDWRFQDVSEQAGIVCTAFGLGIAIGDYDNDGFPDIYLNNFGPNILYHNNGDGTFTDVTGLAGVPGTIKGGRLGEEGRRRGVLPRQHRPGPPGPVRRQLCRNRTRHVRHADEGQVSLLSDAPGVRPRPQHPVPEFRRRHVRRRQRRSPAWRPAPAAAWE